MDPTTPVSAEGAPGRARGARRPLPTLYRVTVTDVRELTPHLRRVTFGGGLESYANDGPSTHCKLLLPAPGQEEVVLPSPGPDGLRWPEEVARPISRTYTPRRVDPAAASLAIDFALHPDGGPATRWAADARPGDRIVVTGGRGAYRIDAGAPWTVLVADASSLPAAATVLEAAPAGARALLFAEVADHAEELELETAAELSMTWLGRAQGEPGRAALDALRQASLPSGDGAFWVCLEASAMRAVRRHLLEERGVARAALYTRGYWKLGTANHPDHDTGEDG